MTGPVLPLALTLAARGLHFRFQRAMDRPGRIQAMSLEITHRCIAQCLMCNIWKIPAHVPDLSLRNWVDLLSSDALGDLRELDITGGEPFLRSDLPDLVAAVCERTHHHLKRLKTIAITTNGLLTDRVLNATRRITEILKNHPLDLVLVCAMDGIGKIHDRIRNVKDAWTRVDATLHGLIDMRARFPRLIIGLKTTVLPMNVDQVGPISQYADSHGLFTIISPCIITAGRYLNLEKAEEMHFDHDQKEQLKAFYRSDTFAWSFHAERLVEYLETGTLKRPCTCGFNYLFVRSNGQVLLCPLVPLSPGNIKDKGLDEILRSPSSNAIRRKVGRFPECSRCTEPGLERYALSYEGFTYLSLLLKMGPERFLRLHGHMGLEKYFE